jgi:hypothetical protein
MNLKIRNVLSVWWIFVAILSATMPSGGAGTNAGPAAFGPFRNEHPDWQLSPYTGLDRAGWLACGRHILEGAFSHVKDLKDPMFLPKMPGPGYPASNEKATRQERSAAIFEAIARTFNLAAPLIKEDPEITIHGIRLRDYYKFHLLQLMTNPACDYFIGYATNYSSQVQQTCELGNISMWSILAPEAFWDGLSQSEKDAVARTLGEWAVGHTLPHNWRWFNVMMATFLDLRGYPCDKEVMRNHVENLLVQHAGDGWYRDTGYDYYTVHVFQLYGSVWVSRYGRQHYPEYAAILDRHFSEFCTHYPQIFGRDGHVIMLGRSSLYRLGASAGMAAAQLHDTPAPGLTPGHARRVASSALLQFVTHPDFFQQGIPALGFYGPFPAAIQGYSCSASPYWMFMNFTCLTLPKEHPFWTDKEEMGSWSEVSPDDQRTEFWPGPGFLVSNHGTDGSTDIRPGKIHNQDPDYSRLVYNSAFPWEADAPEAIASTITLRGSNGKLALPDLISLAGFRDGVFYRQAVFPGHLPPIIDMATIVIPGGEIRVDRLRHLSPVTTRLGHFGLPHLGGTPVIKNGDIQGHPFITAAIPGRQVALTAYQGWDAVESVTHHDAHPESKTSTLVYATKSDKKLAACPLELCISILRHKTDDKPWALAELQPIASVEPLVAGSAPALCGIRIRLHDGKEYSVNFKDIDGTNSTW